MSDMEPKRQHRLDGAWLICVLLNASATYPFWSLHQFPIGLVWKR
ncbi:hypothetical protein [Azospirillum argentinense]